MLKKLICVLLLLGVAASAQTIVPAVGVYINVVRVVPGTMSGSLVCLVGYASGCLKVIAHSATSSDPAVCSADITSNGQNILIEDANTVAWMNAALPSVGTVVTTWYWQNPSTNDSTCRVFPGGVYVQATGSGSTVFSMVIKYNP
jgi:hypothetical protein